MKSILTTLTVVLLACGATYGQDAPSVASKHLKAYGPMIGTWRYEGPEKENVEGYAKEGDEIVFQFSWRRILDGSVVEENWSYGPKNGKAFSGKALIGWNAADKQLVYGGMDSLGGSSLGTVVFDAKAKTSTLTSNEIDEDGKKWSFKGVVTKTGKDTLTWQALERTGGVKEGPSPVYTFKRVKRAKAATK
jgi:hypothetical protein